MVAEHPCTELIDPACIAPIMASHLISLDKSPGIYPIVVGDTARLIIAEAILNITRQDVQKAAEPIQLCAGQIAGIEAAVHAVCSFFQSEEMEALTVC